MDFFGDVWYFKFKGVCGFLLWGVCWCWLCCCGCLGRFVCCLLDKLKNYCLVCRVGVFVWWYDCGLERWFLWNIVEYGGKGGWGWLGDMVMGFKVNEIRMIVYEVV